MDVEKYRAAARDYCNQSGIDPDAMVEDNACVGAAYVLRTNYRWVIVAREMFRLNTMMAALKQHGPNLDNEG